MVACFYGIYVVFIPAKMWESDLPLNLFFLGFYVDLYDKLYKKVGSCPVVLFTVFISGKCTIFKSYTFFSSQQKIYIFKTGPFNLDFSSKTNHVFFWS